MITMKINKTHCEVNIKGDTKTISAETIMASICLIDHFAKVAGTSFDAAALFIMQQSTLAHKQTMEQLESGEC